MRTWVGDAGVQLVVWYDSSNDTDGGSCLESHLTFRRVHQPGESGGCYDIMTEHSAITVRMLESPDAAPFRPTWAMRHPAHTHHLLPAGRAATDPIPMPDGAEEVD